MALATTCPQCKTSFKVVPDQLKLRRGLVRCGVCQHVFSGIDYLRYVDDAARAAQRAAREQSAAAAGGAQRPVAGTPATPPTQHAPAPGDSRAGAAASAEAPARVAETSDASDASDASGASGASGASPVAAGSSAESTTTPTETADGVPATARAAGAFAADTVGPPADPDLPAPTTDPGTPAMPLPGSPEMPADPWAAAARAAHERSLTGEPAVVPIADETDARPGPHAAPGAPRGPERPLAGPLPALPAPAGAAGGGAGPVYDLRDLAARPAAAWPPVAAPSWPPAAGPQTIIPDDDDLKTAFFLTDSAFGPQPGEARDVQPPTSIRHATADPGASEQGAAAPHGPETREAGHSHRATLADGPRSAGAGAAAAALQGPPGLPLRPERRDDALPGPIEFDAEPPPPRAQRTPLSLAPPAAAEPAIDYFGSTRRPGRSLGLALSPSAWFAAVALALLLGLQAVVGWRDAIAARIPALAPAIGAVLSPFGIEVAPPRDLDALTIESFELQSAGSATVLQLSAVLRNRSDHAVAYPAMELTLTDSAGALLVRKVIPADAYLPDAPARGSGLAAHSERPLRLALEHDNLQPTGYSVKLFHP